MTTAREKDWDTYSKELGQSSFDSILEMMLALKQAQDDDKAFEKAEQAIQNDPLSIQVRSGWHTPGETGEAEEYQILLGWGGPAVQIVGELGAFNQPDTAVLQVQDWFKPWTDVHPECADNDHFSSAREVLLEYARQFYFGD